jgi:hypothetical protein
MNVKKFIGIVAVIGLCAAQSVMAAPKAKADKDILQGTWAVSEGVYPDKSVEKELEMSFSFKGDTMTNPMDDSVLAFKIDEKAKTITASDKAGSITLIYRIVDEKNVEFTQMSVKGADGKATTVVGKDGTFTLLKLIKK